jgi:hypothetical protein
MLPVCDFMPDIRRVLRSMDSLAIKQMNIRAIKFHMP